MGFERRKGGRLEVKIPATYKIVCDGKEEILLEGEALIRNISKDGMCLSVEISHAKTMGDLLKNKYQLLVEFILPSSAKIIKPLSKIVWTEDLNESEQSKYNMGLYFIEFDENERKALIDFLNIEYMKHKRSS